MNSAARSVAKGFDSEVNAFIQRYHAQNNVDDLPPGQGVFLIFWFWLADSLALIGRHGEARELYERLLSVRNDVSLFAEEYDRQTAAGRLPKPSRTWAS